MVVLQIFWCGVWKTNLLNPVKFNISLNLTYSKLYIIYILK